ncbi:MAG: hypothetical protein U1B30_02775 [Pseudomonadota bacterium]|nr:hypothetical protein [Pseudomonadota bacterium]
MNGTTFKARERNDKAIHVPRLGRDVILLLSCLCLVGVVPATTFAAGQLMVAPTRIVLDERDRSATINLINTDDETTTYRIDFLNKRMTDNGDFQDIKTPLPDEHFSDGMIHFSPREVVLPPGKSQTIRLMLRKPADLEVGEYHSHMHVKALPAESAKSIETLTSDNNLTIQLTPVIGFEPNLTPDEPAIMSMTMHRQDNRSVYGDITVYFKPDKGDELVVDKARGVAVYSSNPLRHLRLALQPPAGLQLKNGTLRVSFEEAGSGGVAVETSITVQ